MRAGRGIGNLLALTALATFARAAAAQDAPETRDAACFGVSFDRGCFAMLQYEVGYRAAAAGRAPRLDLARSRPLTDQSQLFVAGGLIFATSATTTLGAIYERGTGDEHGTQALGVRWGRQLRENSRLDVTAGAVFLPLIGDSVPPSRTVTSRGAFAEVALHGSNVLTLIVRDEMYPRRAHASGGNLVFAGARAEATPAAIVTLTAAALLALALAATGPNW